MALTPSEMLNRAGFNWNRAFWAGQDGDEDLKRVWEAIGNYWGREYRAAVALPGGMRHRDNSAA